MGRRKKKTELWKEQTAHGVKARKPRNKKTASARQSTLRAEVRAELKAQRKAERQQRALNRRRELTPEEKRRKKERAAHEWINYGKITLGTLITAAALAYFQDPHGIVSGGVTGIGIALRAVTERFGTAIPLSVWNLVINIPLLIAGLFVKGRHFMQRTIYSTLLLSAFLFLMERLPFRLEFDDLFLAAAFGGVLSGLGMGLIVSGFATSGGTDLLAAIIQAKKPHLSVFRVLLIIDTVVIIAGGFVFGIRNALYAIMTSYLNTEFGDKILEGFNRSKAVYIISDEWKTISDGILEKLGRGVTGLDSTGMYTGKTRKTLYCIVSPKELVRLKALTYKADKNAFVIVTDAKEVLGEGFIAVET